jgi:hypothetical protein
MGESTRVLTANGFSGLECRQFPFGKPSHSAMFVVQWAFDGTAEVVVDQFRKLGIRIVSALSAQMPKPFRPHGDVADFIVKDDSNDRCGSFISHPFEPANHHGRDIEAARL